MNVKYKDNTTAKNSDLDEILDNIYIKKDKNIKIYNVGTKDAINKFRRQNHNAYKRYIKHLDTLNLTKDDISVFVDTRSRK